MTTSRRAFKIEFLQKCAESGCTPEEALRIAQTAIIQLEKKSFDFEKLLGYAAWPVTAGLGAAADIIKPIGSAGLAAALLGPPALGLAGGYGLAKLTDADDTDVEALRKKRLIEEYRLQAQRLRDRMKAHTAR